MSKKLQCPPPPLLEDLVQGKLRDPELSDLSEHLEGCAACQERARTVVPSDTLVESLRGGAPASDQIAREAPRELIERLKQIPEGDASGGLGPLGDYDDAEPAPDERELAVLAPAEQPDELGRLGPYRILQVLGRGGMGVVFLAEDTKLARRVALKMMLPRIAANPRARQRFLREARAAAKLKNDHIVTIYEVDEASGVPYLAMELLEGQSLDEVLRGGRQLGAGEIVRIARDVAQGLAAAHDKGLVHRDIKPGNLWLEETHAGPRVKILDFGLARVEAQEASFTHAGAIVGTPEYMAPEQARGNRPVDARADLFSLGCVLYRLSAGESPFQAATTMGTLMAVAMDEPVALAGRNESIPPELARLIMQLLAKDPSRRPQTAAEVLARLNTVVDGQPRATSRSSGLAPGALTLVGLAVAASIILAAIYFWQTPDGRVVRIECDDLAIQIAIASGELKVTGAYQEPLTFKPGKVGLRITRGDDFNFETDKLIVNRGDQIVLKIEVVEGKVQIVQDGKGVIDSKPLAPMQRDPWEASIAGMAPLDQVAAVKARLKELNSQFDETSLSPRIEMGVVIVVEIKDSTTLRDLSPLRGFTGLKELYLDGRFAGVVGLGGLRGMKLKTLMTNNCTFADLSPLAEMPLTTLGCWGCATTDLSPLAAMKLISVNCGNSQIKDISVLKGMPLEFVCVNVSQVEDLSPLAGAPIKSLFAANTKVRDLRPVANAPIEWLAIEGSPIEDSTPLLTMPLKMLEIDNPEKHAAILRKIPTLATINHKPVAEVLGDAVLGDAVAPADPDRRASQWALRLGGAVWINGNQEDIKDIADLPKDRFTVTNVNVVYNPAVTDASLENLRGLQGLKLLNLGGTSVTDEGLIHLKEHKGLTHLCLERLKLTPAGLAHLKDLKELQSLHFHEIPLTDEGLSELMVHKGLTSLVLSYARLTAGGLAQLKHFKELSILQLRGTAATDDTLEHFQDLALISLDLSETKLTDAGLARLKHFKGLRTLWVEKTAVTAKGIADFRSTLPGCEVVHGLGVDAERN